MSWYSDDDARFDAWVTGNWGEDSVHDDEEVDSPYNLFADIDLSNATTAEDVLERDLRLLASLFWCIVVMDVDKEQPK